MELDAMELDGGCAGSGAVAEGDMTSIVAAAQACPDVVRVTAEPVWVTRSPEGGPPVVTVRVVGRFGPTVSELGSQVRAAVRARLADPVEVDVMIDDLDVEEPWRPELGCVPVRRPSRIDGRRGRRG